MDERILIMQTEYLTCNNNPITISSRQDGERPTTGLPCPPHWRPLVPLVPLHRYSGADAARFLAMLALAVNCRAQSPSRGEPTGRPVPLRGVPDGGLVRWPSIAVQSDTIFVAANVFPIS